MSEKRALVFFTGMKLLQLFTLLVVSLVQGELLAQRPFITTWEVTDDDLTININTVGGIGTPDFDVDWGDGTTDINETSASHTYATAGTYTVSVTGTLSTFILANADTQQLLTIEQWGDIEWLSFIQAFNGAFNLQINATDVPDLSSVQDMSSAFAGCRALTGDFSNWDVSNVTNMSFMFASSNFNGDISQWDVSSVTNMRAMFNFDTLFNQDVSQWDVTNATDLSFMFQIATAFDQDLGNWDVSNATDLDEFANESGLSVANYDSLLLGWVDLPSLPSGTDWVGLNLKYCAGREARATLITDYQWTFTNDVFDCNDPTDDIILSNNTIDEGLSRRTFIGALTSEDRFPDQPNTYIISSAENAFAFTNMDSENTIDSLFSEIVFDFETQSSYEITLISLDTGIRIEKNFTIMIKDANEAPTGIDNDLDPGSSFIVVQENTSKGTVVATLSTTDENTDDTHTYAISDDDFMALRVDGNDIVVDSLLNFELLGAANSANVSDEFTLTTTDNEGASFSQTMTLGVTNVNDPPSGVTLDQQTIDENVSAGQVIGSLTTTDEDLTDELQHTYELTGGELGSFEIQGTSLVSSESFDFESQSSYTVNVTTTDPAGASFASNVMVEINDTNDPPTMIRLTETTVAESLEVGRVIGSFSTQDQDESDNHNYAISEGNTVPVSITAGDLILSQELDFAESPELQFTVTSTDSEGAAVDSTFSLSVDAQPVATDVVDIELTDDEPRQDLNLNEVFSDPGGDELEFSFSPMDVTLFDVTLDNSTLTVDNPMVLGTAELTVVAKDSLNQEAEVTFNVAYIEIVLSTEARQVDLVIYPNPAIDEVQMRNSEAFESIQLVDLAGKSYPISPMKNDSGLSISLQHVPPGHYMLWIDMGDRRFSKKLIKK